MDNMTAQIADFAADLAYTDLSAAAEAAAKRSLVDAIGCALGGHGARVSVIARAVAPAMPFPDAPGRIIGEATRSTTGDAAAFANTVMLRYLDFNDRFPGLHPSDSVGAFLGVGESLKASGAQLLTAMAVAYEVANGLARGSKIRTKGIDQGMPVGIAVAAALGNMMGLNRDQIGHAVAIMATSHVPLRIARAGELSPWKAAASAHAIRNAVTVVNLAANGMEGPNAPFEGPDGMFALLGAFELEPFGLGDHDLFIEHVDMKCWPVCYRLQASVFAGLELREQISMDELTKITVGTHATAARGTEPEKFDPQTRETADHSIPYALTRALQTGSVGPEDFEERVFLDPDLRSQMAKIEVIEDPEIEAAYPEDLMVRISAEDKSGKSYRIEVVNPKGHWKNPLNDDDVSTKFSTLATPVIGKDRTVDALSAWWAIDKASELGPSLDRLQI